MPEHHYLGVPYELRRVGGYDVEAATQGGRRLALEQSEPAAHATVRRRLDAECVRGMHIAATLRARLAHAPEAERAAVVEDIRAAAERLDAEIRAACEIAYRAKHIERLRELRDACAALLPAEVAP